MEKEELIELFQLFLDENSLWYRFVDFLEEREGKTPMEIGFNSND